MSICQIKWGLCIIYLKSFYPNRYLSFADKNTQSLFHWFCLDTSVWLCWNKQKQLIIFSCSFQFITQGSPVLILFNKSHHTIPMALSTRGCAVSPTLGSIYWHKHKHTGLKDCQLSLWYSPSSVFKNRELLL